MNKIFEASVVDNKKLIDNHFLITLHPLVKIKKPEPGCFFMLSVNSGLDPLLKRPLSLHRLLDGDFQLLYRAAGKGTAILSRKKTGDTLEVVGPVGNGFKISKSQRDFILVAGGIGIAPIFALTEKLISSGKNVLLFYGARTGEEALCLDKLSSLGIDPVISTDDGSLGKKGNIVDVLKRHISRHSVPVNRQTLFACGPEPMLKALSNLAQKNNLKGHMALEQHMACGIGTCLGCVVNTTGGYKRVCKEGPVFPINEIVW